MTWTDEPRTEHHKQFGDYWLIPQRNEKSETAHLIVLGDRKLRVLPDEAHSGQKRATVCRRALEQVAALNGVPVDLVETYLIGALSKEGLDWVLIVDDGDLRDVSIEEWLEAKFDEWDFNDPQRKAEFFLEALNVDGWEIVRKGET